MFQGSRILAVANRSISFHGLLFGPGGLMKRFHEKAKRYCMAILQLPLPLTNYVHFNWLGMFGLFFISMPRAPSLPPAVEGGWTATSTCQQLPPIGNTIWTAHSTLTSTWCLFFGAEKVRSAFRSAFRSFSTLAQPSERSRRRRFFGASLGSSTPSSKRWCTWAFTRSPCQFV